MNDRYVLEEIPGGRFTIIDTTKNKIIPIMDGQPIIDILNENEKEFEVLTKKFKSVLEELYCKDRVLEENNIPIECCDRK